MKKLKKLWLLYYIDSETGERWERWIAEINETPFDNGRVRLKYSGAKSGNWLRHEAVSSTWEDFERSNWHRELLTEAEFFARIL